MAFFAEAVLTFLRTDLRAFLAEILSPSTCFHNPGPLKKMRNF
jgi:hypothetical protein